MTSIDIGLFKLATETVYGIEQATSNEVPIAADALPTFVVIDPATGNVITTGTCTAFGAYLGAYKFSITTMSPDYQRGQSYLVRTSYAVGGAARAGWFLFKVT